MDLNVGDVVQLKSGGPNMTIHKIARYGVLSDSKSPLEATCKWFNGTDMQSERFALESLKKIDEENI